jgi:Phosphatase
MTDITVAPTRSELVSHLVTHRIAGDVATPRDNNLRNYRRFAERIPEWTFGMTFRREWGFDEVLAMMAERVGVGADPGYTDGTDRIDPELTVAALDRMAGRLRAAAERGERVLFATGHPPMLLAIHLALASTLRRAGCPVIQPATGERVSVDVYEGQPRRGHIVYIGGVAMFAMLASLRHTHSPEPMRLMLAALDRAGATPPDLVVADHGWAGAAGEAGIDTVGFADTNDPALFAGEAEGKIAVAAPLDDGINPAHYAPLIRYLLDRAGLPPDGSEAW